MSDFYELAKCMQPQDVSDTPYESKVYNFISDINSGVYSNNAQSLVQFNLSDIYTATQFVDMSQIYLTLPMVYTACYSSGNAPVAPTANAGNEWLITPKKWIMEFDTKYGSADKRSFCNSTNSTSWPSY